MASRQSITGSNNAGLSVRSFKISLVMAELLTLLDGETVLKKTQQKTTRQSAVTMFNLGFSCVCSCMSMAVACAIVLLCNYYVHMFMANTCARM